MKEAMKIILISFLVSLNVCIWRDALGEVFDITVFAALGLMFGLLLYGLAFHRKNHR